MQRKIFSVDRVPKVRSNLNEFLTLISLASGVACIQIMMSSSPTFAQYTNAQGTTYTNAQGATYNSDGKISVGSGNGDKGDYNIFNDPVSYTAILLGLGATGWIIYNVRAAKAADKRMEEIYQSLPSELQCEFNGQIRGNASRKEHLNLLLNMRKTSRE